MDVAHRGKGVAAVVVAAVLATGCASADAGGPAERRGRTVSVVVENNNWQDANIYVMGAGPRVRLGTVTSMGSERFTIPPTAQRPEGVQLEADLIGSNATKVTNRILVSPGEEVRWTLENHLALSSYSVR